MALSEDLSSGDPHQSPEKLCLCVFVYVQEEGRKQQDTGSRRFLLAACGATQLTVYPSILPPGRHNQSVF